jgi:hypothetical protein
MGWEDRNSVWQRRQRRRVRNMGLGIMGLVLVVVVPQLLVVGLFMGRSSGMALQLLLIVVASILVIVPILLFLWRRERLALVRVPQHNGLVCPLCLQPMESVDRAQPGTPYRCPRGHLEQSADELHIFWEQFGHAAAGRFNWLLPPLRRQQCDRRVTLHEYITRFRYSIPIAVAASIGITLLTPYAYGRLDWFDAVFWGLFFWLPLMIGSVLLIAGAKFRRGDSVFCAACDYEKAPGLDTESCPECGSDWRSPGGVVHGTPQRRPIPYWTGSVLLYLAILVMVTNGIGLHRQLLSVKPSGILLERAGNDAIGSDSIWRELTGRTLTDEQRLTLARDLLKLRREVSYFSATPGAAWLEQEVLQGTLPDDIVERYYRDWLRFELRAPGRARVGEAVVIRAPARLRRGGFNSGRHAYAMIEGFRVGDKPDWIGRATEPLAGVTVSSPEDEELGRWGVSLPTMEDRTPSATITMERPGPLTVRFAVWIVILDGPDGDDEIGWDANGGLTLPTTGVTWSERLELTHEIGVRE